MSASTRPIKEKKVKDVVKKLLNVYGCYYFMPVQSGYGSAALDFICCHKGRFLSVETKAPGKHASPRQELIISNINDAGGTTIVIGESYHETSKTFSGMAELERWLQLAP